MWNTTMKPGRETRSKSYFMKFPPNWLNPWIKESFVRPYV
jgi:hypothetical protein